jgi:hypothetical protein
MQRPQALLNTARVPQQHERIYPSNPQTPPTIRGNSQKIALKSMDSPNNRLALPPGEIHFHQPDLKRYGLVLPILTAGWLWAATDSVSLLVVINDSLRIVPRTYSVAWQMASGLLGFPGG